MKQILSAFFLINIIFFSGCVISHKRLIIMDFLDSNKTIGYVEYFVTYEQHSYGMHVYDKNMNSLGSFGEIPSFPVGQMRTLRIAEEPGEHIYKLYRGFNSPIFKTKDELTREIKVKIEEGKVTPVEIIITDTGEQGIGLFGVGGVEYTFVWKIEIHDPVLVDTLSTDQYDSIKAKKKSAKSKNESKGRKGIKSRK